MGGTGYGHLVTMTSPVDLGAVGLTADGAVTFIGEAWTAKVWTHHGGHIRSLRVDVHNPAALTAGWLASLPLAQMRHIAVREQSRTGRATYPNEDFIRILATPKPAGSRQWDDGHWGRVLAVFEWGRQVGYRGGPRRAVADMWGVSVDPTVARWLRHARRRVPDPPVDR